MRQQRACRTATTSRRNPRIEEHVPMAYASSRHVRSSCLRRPTAHTRIAIRIQTRKRCLGGPPEGRSPATPANADDAARGLLAGLRRDFGLRGGSCTRRARNSTNPMAPPTDSEERRQDRRQSTIRSTRRQFSGPLTTYELSIDTAASSSSSSNAGPQCHGRGDDGFDMPMNDSRMAPPSRRTRVQAEETRPPHSATAERARDESPEHVSFHRDWIIGCLQLFAIAQT